MARKTPQGLRSWRTVVPFIATVAGLLFGISASTSGGTDLRVGQTDLADVVSQANHRVSVKQGTVNDLRGEIDDLSPRSGSSTLTSLNRRIDQLAPQAGMTEVRGKGLKVTLTDSTRDVSSLPEGGNADWLVVHQQDVQAVVNALWRGGATAMMLMDQRVISTSAVRCVGNTLILQGRVYSPPFTITAIGDTSRLRKTLDSDRAVSTYREYVDLAGVGYQVDGFDGTMPAYAGQLELRYATPQREGSE